MKQIGPHELAALLQATSNSTKPPVVLDVREPWEIAIAQIEGSTPIPMREIPVRHSELDRSRTIVCLCHHGARSMQVAMFLEHQGFADVCNLSGGIDAWSRHVDNKVPTY